MSWQDDYPLPWSVGPIMSKGGTSIIDATGKTVLDMGWLMNWELDENEHPILSDRQKEEWGDRDAEIISDLISDGRWESRQAFELAGFIAAAINKAGGS